jgi:hypothetical protein
MRGSLAINAIAVAFAKVRCNFLKRALFPLFCFRQPKNLAFGIQYSALPAHKFLFANFDQPVHELHLLWCEANLPTQLSQFTQPA